MKVKQKRTAADYLAEHGFAGLPDAEDPEEDEDTEVLSSDEGEPPVRQERAHGEGEPPVRRGRERHPPDWWIANNYDWWIDWPIRRALRSRAPGR